MAAEALPVTVDVLTKALQNAAPPWYSSAPVLTLLGVVGGALIGFGGNWYLKRMDRDAWIRQRRWDLKWECYSKVAEHLGELEALTDEVIDIANLTREARSEEREAYERILRPRIERANQQFESYRRYASMARIVVPPQVRTFLTGFGDRWKAARADPEPMLRAVHDAWMGILDHARVDVGLELTPPERR